MPFATRAHADPKVVAKHAAAHRARLRQNLEIPGLSLSQRKAIRAGIARVGQPKVYDVNRPPQPGAIEAVPISVDVAELKRKGPRRRVPTDAAGLSALKKPVLVSIAQRFRLPTLGSKAELVERILVKQGGNS